MTLSHNEGLPIGRDHHTIGEGQPLGDHSCAALWGDEQNRGRRRRGLTEIVPHVADIGTTKPIDDHIVDGIFHEARQVSDLCHPVVFQPDQSAGVR